MHQPKTCFGKYYDIGHNDHSMQEAMVLGTINNIPMGQNCGSPSMGSPFLAILFGPTEAKT